MNRLDTQRVGEDPIRAGGNFGEQIGIACGVQIGRRLGDDIQIGDDRARRGARERIFGAVARDRCAKCHISVHRRRRRDAHVWSADTVRGELGQVVDRARSDADGNRLVMLGKISLEFFDEAVLGMEICAGKNEWLVRMRELLNDFVARDVERNRIGDHDRPALAELPSKYFASALKHAAANYNLARVARRC